MGPDVVDLIMADHREVERVLDIMARQPEQRAMMLPVVSALLIAHSRAEEAEVYPVARAEASATEEIIHSQDEHSQAEMLLEQLERIDPWTDEFTEMLQQLTSAVNEHVQEEESSILPMIREQLEEERRIQLGEAFVRSRAEHFGERPGQETQEELIRQAENLDLPGRASMSKSELNEAIREHATAG